MALTWGYEFPGEAVTMPKSDGTEFTAYVVGEKGAPGVVMVQEWWGVTDEVKSQAVKLSSYGFRVAIPDLYRGKVGVDKEEAHHLYTSLDFGGAAAEIVQLVKWLKSEGSGKVGTIGFCMGGALVLLASLQEDSGIDASAPFYGIPPGADFTKIKVPVEGHFGTNDNHAGFSDPETAKKLGEQLKASGAHSEIFFYEGVAHGFLNESPAAIKLKEELGYGQHNQELVDLAWKRVVDLFNKYLR